MRIPIKAVEKLAAEAAERDAARTPEERAAAAQAAEERLYPTLQPLPPVPTAPAYDETAPLPDITGTDRQVAYATTVRARNLRNLADRLATLTAYVDGTADHDTAYRAVALIIGGSQYQHLPPYSRMPDAEARPAIATRILEETRYLIAMYRTTDSARWILDHKDRLLVDRQAS